MRRTVGGVLAGILITVAAAWTLDAFPDAATASRFATGIWQRATTALEAHIVAVTVTGSLLFVTLGALAVLARERFMSAGIADRIALAAIGILFLVAGSWLVIRDSPWGAIAFLTAGAGMVIVSAHWIARYLRISTSRM